MNRPLYAGIGRRQFVACALGAGLALAAAPAIVRPARATENEGAAHFTAGTYEGSGMGRKGPISVKVTFSDTAIESIEVIESHETPRIAESAFTQIPAAIIEYQSLDVDSVTGATLTSFGLTTAIEDCVEQAGGDVDALTEVPGPQKTDASETIDCDVLVIGSGSAGTVAAMECAMRGAKVAVMEKSSNIGGNALVCGGVLDWMCAPEEMRAESTAGYDEYFEQTLQQGIDSFGVPKEVVDEIRQERDDYYATGTTKVFDSTHWQYVYTLVASGAGAFDQAAYDAYGETLEANAAMFDWLNQTGIEWKTPLVAVAGYPWPTCTSPTEGECGAGYFLAFEDYIADESLPIDFLMATPASELTVTDGRVTGAKGQCADGTSYTVNASRAVILATGGFSGNAEMLKKYGAEWDFASMDVIPTDNAYGHTGDALQLAQAAGAPTPADQSVYVMILPFANAVDYSVESIVGDSGNALLVNKDGVRFVDEAQGRNFIARAEMEQPDQMSYLISDVNGSLITDGLNMFGIEEEMLLLQKKCCKAGTIEELAEMVGLDPQTLAATVETFNGYADAGEDPDFGRTMFTEASKVVEPPFYACPCTWAVHITAGIVPVDASGAVTDAEGNPIEGLYAIGEAAGSAGITNMGPAINVAAGIMA